MKLVYAIQLVFLLAAFLYGYRYEVTVVRMVLFTFANELLYGMVVYFLNEEVDSLAAWGVSSQVIESMRLTIFDMVRLEKEQWLPNFIHWLAARFGRNISWRFDTVYQTLAFTGGFFITLTTALGGTIFRNALQQQRKRQAGHAAGAQSLLR